VERDAAQIPEATIDPETWVRLLPPKAPERWRELAKAEVGYTIGAVGGAVSGQAMIAVRAVPGDESTQPPVGVWVLCYDGPPWLAGKRDEYEEWSEWWRPQPPAPPTESAPGARKRALGSITAAMEAVEAAGASDALTDAVHLLGQARDRVADHVEGKGAEPAPARPASEPEGVPPTLVDQFSDAVRLAFAVGLDCPREHRGATAAVEDRQVIESLEELDFALPAILAELRAGEGTPGQQLQAAYTAGHRDGSAERDRVLDRLEAERDRLAGELEEARLDAKQHWTHARQADAGQKET
jgi:hypothetical protein